MAGYSAVTPKKIRGCTNQEKFVFVSKPGAEHGLFAKPQDGDW